MSEISYAEQAAFRELNEDEIEAISGGVKYECTVKIDSKGNKTIECKISGEF